MHQSFNLSKQGNALEMSTRSCANSRVLPVYAGPATVKEFINRKRLTSPLFHKLILISSNSETKVNHGQTF